VQREAAQWKPPRWRVVAADALNNSLDRRKGHSAGRVEPGVGTATSCPPHKTAHFLTCRRAAPSAITCTVRSISQAACPTASASISRWVSTLSQVRSSLRARCGACTGQPQSSPRASSVFGVRKAAAKVWPIKTSAATSSLPINTPWCTSSTRPLRHTLVHIGAGFPLHPFCCTLAALPRFVSLFPRQITIAAASQRACQVRQRSRAPIEALSSRPLRDSPRARCSCVVSPRAFPRHNTLNCTLLIPSNSAS
jgi:hypothetical protein